MLSILHCILLLAFAMSVIPACVHAQAHKRWARDTQEEEVEEPLYVAELVPKKPVSGAYSRRFFEHDSVRGIFSNQPVDIAPKVPISMLKPENAELPSTPTPPVPGEEELAEEEIGQEVRPYHELSKDEFRQEMVKRFGPPEQNPIVEPADQAPACFKAASYALQVGDVESARKYADCYARHERSASDMRKEIMALSREAIHHEQNPDAPPLYPGYETLYAIDDDKLAAGNKGKKASEKQQDEGFRTTRIDDLTRALIAHGEKLDRPQAAAGPEFTVDEDEPSGFSHLRLSDKEARQKARLDRTKVIPRDPQGALRVYFFFDSKDFESYAMFPVLERIYKEQQGNHRVHIVAFSRKKLLRREESSLQKRMNVSFPVRSGARLAKQMGVARSNTLALLAPSTGEVLLEEGLRSYAYVDELVKMSTEVRRLTRAP